MECYSTCGTGFIVSGCRLPVTSHQEGRLCLIAGYEWKPGNRKLVTGDISWEDCYCQLPALPATGIRYSPSNKLQIFTILQTNLQ